MELKIIFILGYLILGYSIATIFVAKTIYGVYTFKDKMSRNRALVIAVFSGLTWFLAPLHMMIYEDWHKTYWRNKRAEVLESIFKKL